MADSPERLWRVSALGRAATIAGCIGFVILGTLLLADGEKASDRAWGAVMLLVAPTAAWLFGWRPYIALTAGEVVIQNPLRKHRIPLGAVIGARAGYSGLSLDVRGRKRPLSAWAVQKMNLSAWRGRDTRADAVAKTIAAAACAPGLEPTTVQHPRHDR